MLLSFVLCSSDRFLGILQRFSFMLLLESPLDPFLLSLVHIFSLLSSSACHSELLALTHLTIIPTKLGAPWKAIKWSTSLTQVSYKTRAWTWNTVSLCMPGWPQSQRDLLASASWRLGLKTGDTSPSSIWFLTVLLLCDSEQLSSLFFVWFPYLWSRNISWIYLY